ISLSASFHSRRFYLGDRRWQPLPQFRKPKSREAASCLKPEAPRKFSRLRISASSISSLGKRRKSSPSTRSFPIPRRSNTRISPSLVRSEEHTSELQSRENLVCRLLLEKKK